MDPPSLKCAIFSGCLSSANEGVIVRSKWRRALSEKSGDFGGSHQRGSFTERQEASRQTCSPSTLLAKAVFAVILSIRCNTPDLAKQLVSVLGSLAGDKATRALHQKTVKLWPNLNGRLHHTAMPPRASHSPRTSTHNYVGLML